MGNTVLLRGGPGTGKTTLAAQIARHFVETLPKCALFMSLEQTAERVAEHLEQAFELKLPERVYCINRSEFEQKVWSHLTPDVVANGAARQGLGLVGEVIAEIVKEKIGFDAQNPASRAMPPILVIIDSLNLMTNVILTTARAKKIDGIQDMRDALRIIGDVGLSLPHQGIIVFIGEYDPTNEQASTLAAESYFCDIDIQLYVEPVIEDISVWQQAARSTDDACTLNLPSGRKGTERRLFCRVLKSRNTKHQSRRCAYEIVDKVGLEFYETYPGDGQMMLFAENEPQRKEWRDFVSQDVLPMYLYPSLDVNIFDRSGLQRTFTSMRRFLNMPERTDMYVSSFDTYWLNCYVELCQRLELAKFLKMELAQTLEPDEVCRAVGNEESRPLFFRMVAKMQEVCGELLTTDCSSVPDEIAKKIYGEVCVQCKWRKTGNRCKYCHPKALKDLLARALDRVSREKVQTGLLLAVEERKLRLFGDRRSPVIEDLDPPKAKEGRPLHRPHGPAGKNKMCAVPYNANVSFLGYRKELMHYLQGSIGTEELSNAIRHAFDEIDGGWMKASNKENVDVEEASRRGQDIRLYAMQLAKAFREKAEYQPQTWEEVIALCRLGSQLIGKKLHFLVETRTFDTFACTLMEIIWSGGWALRVHPDYSMGVARIPVHQDSVPDKESKDAKDVEQVLFRAFYLLNLMFSEGIIPCNCSLEPEDLAGYSTAKSDWLLARHWHSTFVDFLTAKRHLRDQQKELIWKPDPTVRLDIMPIPISLQWYASQCRENVENKTEPAESASRASIKHISCWGEWYFGIMGGTENETLAVDLIDNLMSSRKVCNRAFAGAALPTVEGFYEMYGEAGCFNLPERPSELLPKTTYKEIRENLFKNAKSRTDVFDYVHCVRELHSVLEYVRTSTKLNPEDLLNKVRKAMQGIEELGAKEMLAY